LAAHTVSGELLEICIKLNRIRNVRTRRLRTDLTLASEVNCLQQDTPYLEHSTTDLRDSSGPDNGSCIQPSGLDFLSMSKPKIEVEAGMLIQSACFDERTGP